MVGGLGRLVRLALLATYGLFSLAYKLHVDIDGIDGSCLLLKLLSSNGGIWLMEINTDFPKQGKEEGIYILLYINRLEQTLEFMTFVFPM